MSIRKLIFLGFVLNFLGLCVTIFNAREEV
nr:MAG TPA: hypothetical protein [Bacteriophage sp.]DAQ30424.1 MAG TPA: hypothetical protein [Caudoviricetes sp.]